MTRRIDQTRCDKVSVLMQALSLTMDLMHVMLLRIGLEVERDASSLVWDLDSPSRSKQTYHLLLDVAQPNLGSSGGMLLGRHTSLKARRSGRS